MYVVFVGLGRVGCVVRLHLFGYAVCDVHHCLATSQFDCDLYLVYLLVL